MKAATCSRRTTPARGPYFLAKIDPASIKLAQVDVWKRARELSVVHEIAARCEETQTRLVRRSADRIEHGCRAAAIGVPPDLFDDVRDRTIDDVSGAGSARVVRARTARNADHRDTASGERRDEQSSNCTGSAPDDRSLSLRYRTMSNQARGGDSRVCSGGAVPLALLRWAV